MDSARDGELYPGMAAPSGYRNLDHVGGELFVAGQVPHDAGGELVGVGDAGDGAPEVLADGLAKQRRGGGAVGVGGRHGAVMVRRSSRPRGQRASSR